MMTITIEVCVCVGFLISLVYQLSYIFLSCPVDQEACISEQMEDPVTLQQFNVQHML